MSSFSTSSSFHAIAAPGSSQAPQLEAEPSEPRPSVARQLQVRRPETSPSETPQTEAPPPVAPQTEARPSRQFDSLPLFLSQDSLPAGSSVTYYQEGNPASANLYPPGSSIHTRRFNDYLAVPEGRFAQPNEFGNNCPTWESRTEEDPQEFTKIVKAQQTEDLRNFAAVSSVQRRWEHHKDQHSYYSPLGRERVRDLFDTTIKKRRKDNLEANFVGTDTPRGLLSPEYARRKRRRPLQSTALQIELGDIPDKIDKLPQPNFQPSDRTSPVLFHSTLRSIRSSDPRSEPALQPTQAAGETLGKHAEVSDKAQIVRTGTKASQKVNNKEEAAQFTVAGEEPESEIQWPSSPPCTPIKKDAVVIDTKAAKANKAAASAANPVQRSVNRRQGSSPIQRPTVRRSTRKSRSQLLQP